MITKQLCAVVISLDEVDTLPDKPMEIFFEASPNEVMKT